ncbi:MAG: 3-deoxy-manno-octulosonate cytidylyltransferase [Neisseriaceae bacterium]|nr:MAG: 3-deoxy-manno-octulosonate cytidylyltransferase [Neisseriaceae bacterium]
MMSDFTVVIPARMSSTRLPRKMLLDVVGLPLIVRVAHQAAMSKAKRVVVATDHEEILAVCKQHNLDVVMTSPEHQSGTDRIAEVVQQLNLAEDEIIVNVQGDEPLIDPELINQLASFIAAKRSSIATIAHPIHSAEEVFNPNVVKVVLNKDNLALYFSRAAIPYYREGFNNANDIELPKHLNVLRHIGIYAYQVSFLNIYNQLPSCPLEQVEALEQLRALYNGYKIAVMTTTHAPAAGVDTLEDLLRVRQIILAQEK